MCVDGGVGVVKVVLKVVFGVVFGGVKTTLIKTIFINKKVSSKTTLIRNHFHQKSH